MALVKVVYLLFQTPERLALGSGPLVTWVPLLVCLGWELIKQAALVLVVLAWWYLGTLVWLRILDYTSWQTLVSSLKGAIVAPIDYIRVRLDELNLSPKARRWLRTLARAYAVYCILLPSLYSVLCMLRGLEGWIYLANTYYKLIPAFFLGWLFLGGVFYHLVLTQALRPLLLDWELTTKPSFRYKEALVVVVCNLIAPYLCYSLLWLFFDFWLLMTDFAYHVYYQDGIWGTRYPYVARTGYRWALV